MVLQRYLVATYDMTPQFKRLNKNVIDSNTKHLKGFAIGQEKLTIITKRQFLQLRKEAWKRKKIQDFNGVWTRDLAIPVRCSTNWAMKPLTLGAGQLWVHMFPWKKWVLMIYEINHIWTAEMK